MTFALDSYGLEKNSGERSMVSWPSFIVYVYYMFVIFSIWQCPYLQVIAIHEFPKIHLCIRMSDFEAKKRKYFGGFYKYARHDVYRLINDNYKY